MILLDTNVISEPMRAEPARAVLDKFDGQDATELFLSPVTEAESRAGVACRPQGQRRERVQVALGAMIDQDCQGRILPFDSLAARPYAEIAAGRRAAGQPMAEPDCQIAAIACAADAPVTTRNTADFDGCGIWLINPSTAA